MRGIEAAFWATLGKDPELKTSKGGRPFATMNAAVIMGEADDGREINQWVRLVAFGDTAEKIAGAAKKGDRVYCEGSLTLNNWTAATGEMKTGLNLAAFKCEKVPAIGRNKPKREPDQNNGMITASSFAGPHTREKPQVMGRDKFDFDDEIQFGRG
jgi:single-strand DNA-binding protein